MNFQELKDFLDEKANLYNHIDFIENDPSEISYMTALRTTYTLKEGEAFRMYLSKLKEEEFVLNDLNYETLQFFLRGE